MFNISRYIEKGYVKRDRIVADIKKCRISKNDIFELDKNPEVSSAYFATGKFKKHDRSEWDEDYLDELSLAAVSEEFNKEYLLYLSDVAYYVADLRQKKERKIKIWRKMLIVVIAIAFLCIAVVSILRTRRETTQLAINSIAVGENMYLCLIKILK